MDERRKPKIIEEKQAPASQPEEETRNEGESAERKPKIRMVVEPVVHKPRHAPAAPAPTQATTPRLIQEMQENAARDILPTRAEPGTPFQARGQETEREKAVRRAHEIWEQKEHEKHEKKPSTRLKRLLGLKA